MGQPETIRESGRSRRKVKRDVDVANEHNWAVIIGASRQVLDALKSASAVAGIGPVVPASSEADRFFVSAIAHQVGHAFSTVDHFFTLDPRRNDGVCVSSQENSAVLWLCYADEQQIRSAAIRLWRFFFQIVKPRLHGGTELLQFSDAELGELDAAINSLESAVEGELGETAKIGPSESNQLVTNRQSNIYNEVVEAHVERVYCANDILHAEQMEVPVSINEAKRTFLELCDEAIARASSAHTRDTSLGGLPSLIHRFLPLTSILYDPANKSGVIPPFKFEMKRRQLPFLPAALSQVFRVNNPWDSTSVLVLATAGTVIETHSASLGSDRFVVNEGMIDEAKRVLRNQLDAWQRHWRNDSDVQLTNPLEWVRRHARRLAAQINELRMRYQIEIVDHNGELIKKLPSWPHVAIPLKAVRDLALALAADLPPGNQFASDPLLAWVRDVAKQSSTAYNDGKDRWYIDAAVDAEIEQLFALESQRQPRIIPNSRSKSNDLRELESQTPPLERGSGQWLRSERAAEAENLEGDTLRRYRTEGQKTEDGAFGRDRDGRIWRRDGTPRSRPWYLRSTLKSAAT